MHVNIKHFISDVRHQDAILYHVQEVILNRQSHEEIDEPPSDLDIVQSRMANRRMSKRESKIKDLKEKDKKAAPDHVIKFEMKLPGDTILAGK